MDSGGESAENSHLHDGDTVAVGDHGIEDLCDEGHDCPYHLAPAVGPRSYNPLPPNNPFVPPPMSLCPAGDSQGGGAAIGPSSVVRAAESCLPPTLEEGDFCHHQAPISTVGVLLQHSWHLSLWTSLPYV